jgi:hypothetical protein
LEQISLKINGLGYEPGTQLQNVCAEHWERENHVPGFCRHVKLKIMLFGFNKRERKTCARRQAKQASDRDR